MRMIDATKFDGEVNCATQTVVSSMATSIPANNTDSVTFETRNQIGYLYRTLNHDIPRRFTVPWRVHSAMHVRSSDPLGCRQGKYIA